MYDLLGELQNFSRLMHMVISWTVPTEVTGMEEVIVNEPQYASEFAETDELLESLCQPVRDWFISKFPDFTDPQKLAIPVLQSGEHLLLCSPTGSGKTLTAFLSIIDDLVRKAMVGNLNKTVQCVYISPIKALANDIQKNLIEPLREIKEGFLPSGSQDIVVGLRTGDTSQSERQKMLKNPPHILITTPESLALAIGSSRFRPILQDLRYLIVDEMHSLVPTKRGTHLALTLAHLDHSISKPVQRIGISATMEPLRTVAEFLVSSDSNSNTPVTIAHISGSRRLDLDILLPTDRFNNTAMKDILDRNVEVIKELINAHNTTLVFANTRRMTEVLVQKLRAVHVEGVEGHHGSMDKKIRLDVEQKLKRGELRAVVSSSSLEMGIDIGSVDMVIQVGSPGSIATALQRIGRAGHHVGGVPRARLLPTGTHDLLELVALQNCILSGKMDQLSFPEKCLDVLAQYLIGLVIQEDWDIDDAFELVTMAWPYRDLDYDDFIEVLDMLHEERRVWVDWEENSYTKRGYSRMIYYTNIGTISPDNNYLVFTQDGTLVGQLSGSFVQNLRSGDVFLLGGQTYRVHAINSTRVNVSPVTGHRPTVPSWTGESMSRTRELSESVLQVLKQVGRIVRMGGDPRILFKDVYGLSNKVSDSLGIFLEEHFDETFLVPHSGRILVEQLEGNIPTYVVTTCRGRAFNMALGYLFAALAEGDDINVNELSFDENGFLIKLTKEVNLSKVSELVSDGKSRAILRKFLIDSQLFQKRFRAVSSRSMIIPRRIGAEEVSAQQFQQKSEALLRKHRQMESGESLLIRETENEIYHSDLDIIGLNDFISKMSTGEVHMVHSRVKLPSPLGMNLYISSFEDLLTMRARAFLVKDIDPEILRRLLGRRSLQTDLDPERIDRYYFDKVGTPDSPEGLRRLMEMGGGLVIGTDHPLYAEKLAGISTETIQSWMDTLSEEGRILRVNGTGSPQIDGKWFSKNMAYVHGTLGVLSTEGGPELDNVRNLYTGNLSFQVTTSMNDSGWSDVGLSDPHECLRVKILDMLGAEGPMTLDVLLDRLPFPRAQIESILHELEVRNLLAVGFYKQTKEGEYILRIDEYRITGGTESVIESRRIQNMLLDKSFQIRDDPLEVMRNHIMLSKQEEMLYRASDYRFGDWSDIKHDTDVLMGRLLNNRIGYTLKSEIPLILGLRPEMWRGENEEKLLTFVPNDRNIERKELEVEFLRSYSKDDKEKGKREFRNAVNNIDRLLCVAKQYQVVPNRKRSLSLFHRIIDAYEPMNFKDALEIFVKRLGPIRLYTIRNNVTRPVEEIADTLKELEDEGKIVRIVTLQPDPIEFYSSPVDSDRLQVRPEEDRSLRILTQSDPYCSRFIQEIRFVLRDGWYRPVFKGIDPIGRILMFKVNDYLEIKDVQIPHAYLDEFATEFERLLDNFKDQLIDVAVLHQFNALKIPDSPPEIQELVAKLGFKPMNDERMRYIRGGVVETRSNHIVHRSLFHIHNLHQSTRKENEVSAIREMDEVRDTIALRGRCEVMRADLDAMAASNQLHQGTNLRRHLVWATFEHFQQLLMIRNMPAEEELWDVMDAFTENTDPRAYMERFALKRSEFRKLIQPLLRSGHMVQDYRGGFKVVPTKPEYDVWEVKKAYLRASIMQYPVISMKQMERIVGSSFKPEEIAQVLHDMEESKELIKGFLTDDSLEIQWGQRELIEKADKIDPMRDFVLPPSDPLLPYFSGILRERFGFGSAYMVFHQEEPIAAFKANTRNEVFDVTDFNGDPEKEKQALRVMKEFAWEHNMPLVGKVIERLRARISRQS